MSEREEMEITDEYEIKQLKKKLKIAVEAMELLRQNLKWDAGNSKIIREALKQIE